MLLYTLRRILLGVAILFTISIAVFVLTNVAIDPAISLAGEGASSEDIASVRQSYGLDRPVIVRYADWLGDAIVGDFGNSYRQLRPVTRIIFERFPVTLELACLSLLFSFLIAMPLALLGSLRPGSLVDRIGVTLAVIGQAVPTFWLALVLILLFSVKLGWLPVSGSARFANFIMPAICLGFFSMPAILRLTRSGLIEVLEADYIRTARAKGLRMPRVLLKHALRNAVIPVVSIASVQFGYLLSGSVVIETVFAMHGIGYLAWEAVAAADLPIIQALVLVTAAFYVVLTLLADLLNATLDPRMRIA